jgi:GR25 family glycosyltransferase involved in LPS biosynthesis
MNNLKGFPCIYYINLDRDIERNEYIINQFKQYNIKKWVKISASNFCGNEKERWENIVLDKENLCSPSEVGCTLSHIESIETWLKTSKTKVAIIMEDDCDMSISKNWAFSWKDVCKNLPFDWDVIQLCMDHNEVIPFYLHPTLYESGSCSCYMINRNYAKKILKLIKRGEKYKLTNNTCDNFCYKKSSIIEYLIYQSGKSYTIPLFTVNTDFSSNHTLKKRIHPRHEPCKNVIKNFWEKEKIFYHVKDYFLYNKKNDNDMMRFLNLKVSNKKIIYK